MFRILPCQIFTYLSAANQDKQKSSMVSGHFTFTCGNSICFNISKCLSFDTMYWAFAVIQQSTNLLSSLSDCIRLLAKAVFNIVVSISKLFFTFIILQRYEFIFIPQSLYSSHCHYLQIINHLQCPLHPRILHPQRPHAYLHLLKEDEGRLHLLLVERGHGGVAVGKLVEH